MTFKQVCSVKNNQVVITLPPNFVNKKQVTVVIEEIVDSKTQKLALMKQAATDPLFLADLEEINNDFDAISNETL